MVTLADVAKAAGVSPKTVSRVANNDAAVAEKTRKHVLRFIHELGYRPNTAARSLASGRAGTVGVVIHLSAREVFGYPFFNELLGGISEVLEARGINMLLQFAYETNTPYADLFMQNRVDGLILLSIPMDDPNLANITDVPSVFTCRVALDDNPTHWIDADHEQGTRIAMEHLLELGHTRIAMMAGPQGRALSHLRLRGYKDALSSAGISLRDELVRFGELFIGEGETPTRTFMTLPEPPTAIVCVNDLVAVETIRELRAMDYRVPEDVSVIGSDATLLARYASPAVTTIRQKGYEKGRMAAEAIIHVISRRETPIPLMQRKLPMELIVRESTAPVSEG